MAVLFESSGNFTSGESSYWGLISKRSQGTIILSESSFSFKSEKDSIFYDIKLSTIQNFYLVKRFRLTSIEMISDQGVHYTFFPRKKKSKRFSSSNKLTKELFKNLVRSVYKKNYPILFETKACLIKNEDLKSTFLIPEKLHYGILIFTEEELVFKSFKKDLTHIVKILEMNEIKLQNKDSKFFLKVQLFEKKGMLIFTLKDKSKRNRRDKGKTIKLHELLVQVKEYKISEKIREKEEEENRIEQLKAMFEVSNKIKLEMIRIALDMNEKSFTEKIFEWAKRFKFLIDGDYLIVNNDTITEFLDNLRLGFDLTIRQGLKVVCKNCEKSIDYTARICPYCGKEL